MMPHGQYAVEAKTAAGCDKKIEISMNHGINRIFYVIYPEFVAPFLDTQE